MIKLHVDSDQLTSTIHGLLAVARRPRAILQAAARSIRRDLQRHFRVREQTPNAMGGQRTHWWARVSRSTQIASVDDHQAVVSISEPGIALKVYGGTVRPVEKRALTIPIHPEAYGRRADTVESITGRKLWRFQPKKTGPAFLARSLGDDQIRLLYVLKASVTMRPDPDALPSVAAMEQSALKAAQDQLQSDIARQQRSQGMA